MVDPSEREAFRNLLVDLFAIRAAEDLKVFTLPDAATLEKFRQLAAPRADAVLRRYEHALAVDEIRQAVINELRDDLVARSRVAKLIEVAINISLLVVGGLIGLSQFIFDPVKNTKEIAAVYYALLLVVALQLAGNLYLKYFDKRR